MAPRMTAVEVLERKTVQANLVAGDLQFKDNQGGTGNISGYAATFGNQDEVGDVILPGAFTNSLPAFLQNGFVAYGHDPIRPPVAIPVKAYQDDLGLWLSADFHSTAPAQEARTIAAERKAAGKSVAFSIGYMVPPEGAEYRSDGVRLLKQIDLKEVSIVNLPANSLALVDDVKSSLVADTFYERICALGSEAVDVAMWATKHAQDALRRKEGRAIAERRRDALKGARDALRDALTALSDLLDETEPAAKPSGTDSEAQDEPPKDTEKSLVGTVVAEVKRDPREPGTLGTVEYYRRTLDDFESWAVLNGVSLSHDEERKKVPNGIEHRLHH